MIRLLGAAVLLAGCGGFGFSLGASNRREARELRQVKKAVQEMEWELKYRMTELPELCGLVAAAAGGQVGKVFASLAEKLTLGEVEDLSGSFQGILANLELTRPCRKNLRLLGSSLGRYDLEGQLLGLEAVRHQCEKDLLSLEEGGRQRIRSYQTLTLCAGAALAILLL